MNAASAERGDKVGSGRGKSGAQLAKRPRGPAGKCVLCVHPERNAIEVRLIRGDSLAQVASEVGVSATTVARHRRKCLERVVSSSVSLGAVHARVNVLTSVSSVIAEAERFIKLCEKSRDYRTCMHGLDRVLRGLELVQRLQSNDQQTISIERSAEWIELRDCIFAALTQYPEALASVMAALGRLRAGGGFGKGDPVAAVAGQ